MRSRACIAIPLLIAFLAFPSVAAADDPRPGVAAAQIGAKDYSKNAAGGDYARSDERAAAEAALRIRGEALNQAMSPAAPTPKANSGFEWDDAAIGAGVALALVALLAGLAVVRHRIGDVGASPARTYGS
jgi:hypothetical protein